MTLLSEPKQEPTVHLRHPGFSSMIVFPHGHSLWTRGLSLSKSMDHLDDWFMQPQEDEPHEDAWAERIFELGRPQNVYYRGPLVFTWLNGQLRVEPRESSEALVFDDGAQRSMFDAGYCLQGRRSDGAIIFQSAVRPQASLTS